MSRVLAQVQEQLRNAESSMKFMQAEHAQTLRGLHDEIHKLQTKCSELTFELHMLGDNETPPPTTAAPTCSHTGEIESLKKRYKTKLSDLHNQNSQLKTGLAEKQARIKLLQFQLTSTKTDLTDSLAKKDVLIKSLRTDLEGKSDQLAFLMSKIHSAKVIQMKVGPADQELGRFTPTPPPLRPRSRHHSVELSSTSDPITSAAAEILSAEQEQNRMVVSQSVPLPTLPAIGDSSATRSFLSKMKLNRARRDSKQAPAITPYKAT